jgi:hypothetical protein
MLVCKENEAAPLHFVSNLESRLCGTDDTSLASSFGPHTCRGAYGILRPSFITTLALRRPKSLSNRDIAIGGQS